MIKRLKVGSKPIQGTRVSWINSPSVTHGEPFFSPETPQDLMAPNQEPQWYSSVLGTQLFWPAGHKAKTAGKRNRTNQRGNNHTASTTGNDNGTVQDGQKHTSTTNGNGSITLQAKSNNTSNTQRNNGETYQYGVLRESTLDESNRVAYQVDNNKNPKHSVSSPRGIPDWIMAKFKELRNTLDK